eukprot:2835866-Pyramimonas_sp.AAC.1
MVSVGLEQNLASSIFHSIKVRHGPTKSRIGPCRDPTGMNRIRIGSDMGPRGPESDLTGIQENLTRNQHIPRKDSNRFAHGCNRVPRGSDRETEASYRIP